MEGIHHMAGEAVVRACKCLTGNVTVMVVRVL